MGDRVGDRAEVVVAAGDIGADDRDGEVVELLEVLEHDRGRLRVELREDDVRARADDLLHLGAVRRLTRGHGDVGDDRVAELLPRRLDRLGDRLLGDVGGEEQRRLLVALLVRVQRHGDAQLGVGRAVAPEVLVGVLVEGGAAALELGRDLGGADDRRHRGDLLRLGADDAGDVVGGEQLAHGRHRVGLVALRVGMAEVELLAEDAAVVVDDLLGHLGALQHRLAEDGQRAGEAGEDAEADVAGAVGLDVAAAPAAAGAVELPQAATSRAAATAVSRRLDVRARVPEMAVDDTVRLRFSGPRSGPRAVWPEVWPSADKCVNGSMVVPLRVR